MDEIEFDLIVSRTIGSLFNAITYPRLRLLVAQENR
jgi:hypothetical protein